MRFFVADTKRRHLGRKRQSRRHGVHAPESFKVLCAGVFLLNLILAGMIYADTDNRMGTTRKFDIDIPELNAADGLNVLAEQTDAVLLFPYQDASSRQANSVRGRYALMDALTVLLDGSGLAGGLSEDGAIKISIAENLRRNKKTEERKTMKKSKLSLGILAALGAIFTTGADAQDAKAPIEPDALEEVVVLGTRFVNQNAINNKRNSIQVVDSIGENEVGGLAAGNAAELLTQISGLNSFEDLSGRGSGGSTGPEVRFVSIRGIRPDLNLTLLDGLTLAVPNFENRAQFLDWFPVNLAGRTDVVKTFTSSMDPGAIGGQIDFVTRRSVDYAEPLVTFTAETGQTEHDSSVLGVNAPLRLEALYVGQLTENIGLAASASFNKRDTGKPSQLTRGRARSIDFPDVNDVRVVREHRILSESSPTERTGFSVKFDYTPDTDSYAWVTAGYNTVDQTLHHAKTDVRIPSSATGLTLDAVGQSGTLRIDDSGIGFGLRRSAFSEVGEFVNESDLTFIQTGYEKLINDDLTLLAKGGYSKASNSRDAEYYLFMRRGGVTDVAFDGSDAGHPQLGVVDPVPGTYFDPGQYSLLYRNLLPEKAEEEVIDILSNIAFNADQDDEGWGVKAGLRYKKTDRFYDFDWTTRYDIANETNEGSGFTLADAFASHSADLSPPGSSSSFPAFYPDINAAHSMFAPSLDDTSVFRFERLARNEFGADYDIVETTSSLFVEGVYQSEKLQSIFGLRYENTKTDGAGFRDEDGTYMPHSSSASNQFLLPSLLVNYNYSDNVKFRFAASQTLGRPAFPQVAPTGDIVRLGLQNTITRSNPDLEPRRSTNLDMSAEWYFKPDSILSAALFAKKIDDEILDETTTNVTIDGIVFDEVTEPTNATSADLLGLEVSLITYFDFLPGAFQNLGISANGIWIDASFDTTGTRGEVDFLVHQPDQISNFSLLYTDERFDASLNWNHTGQLPTVFNSSDANGDRFNEGKTTLSAKFLYYVNDHLQVFVNGQNLTSEDSVEFTGEGFLYHNRAQGKTINLGFTYKL